MEIRILATKDIKQLVSLSLIHDEFNVCNENDWWSEEELIQWINSPEDLCIGVFENDIMVGYLLSHFKVQLSKVFLENIFIEKNKRRKGYAKLLIHHTLEFYNSKYMNKKSLRFVALVKENNSAILNLITNLGFKVGEKVIWIQK